MRLWSNSPGIVEFTSAKPLSQKVKAKLQKHKLATSYVDPRTGKKRFDGKSKALKNSGCLICIGTILKFHCSGNLVHVFCFGVGQAIPGGLWFALPTGVSTTVG